MGVYVKWVILIIILLFFITFGVKNSQPVYLNYYFNMESLELPLYALAYIGILVGIFIGMIVGILSRLSLGRKVKILEKENKQLRETVKEPEIETSIEEQAPASM
ncbi:MAG: LapA family protein [Desulfobacterales bacterium]|nr:LapA family protein [Desulfobacterales bacterium]